MLAQISKPLSDLIQYIKHRQKPAHPVHIPNTKVSCGTEILINMRMTLIYRRFLKSKELKMSMARFLPSDSPHGHYYQDLLKAGIFARKICLVQDPYQRLYSHVRDLEQVSSKKELLDLCNQENLYNLMDRYIYDYNLFKGLLNLLIATVWLWKIRIDWLYRHLRWRLNFKGEIIVYKRYSDAKHHTIQ